MYSVIELQRLEYNLLQPNKDNGFNPQIQRKTSQKCVLIIDSKKACGQLSDFEKTLKNCTHFCTACYKIQKRICIIVAE